MDRAAAHEIAGAWKKQEDGNDTQALGIEAALGLVPGTTDWTLLENEGGKSSVGVLTDDALYVVGRQLADEDGGGTSIERFPLQHSPMRVIVGPKDRDFDKPRPLEFEFMAVGSLDKARLAPADRFARLVAEKMGWSEVGMSTEK